MKYLPYYISAFLLAVVTVLTFTAKFPQDMSPLFGDYLWVISLGFSLAGFWSYHRAYIASQSGGKQLVGSGTKDAHWVKDEKNFPWYSTKVNPFIYGTIFHTCAVLFVVIKIIAENAKF